MLTPANTLSKDVAIGTYDECTCSACGVDRFTPDERRTPEGVCAACVNDKRVYICKTCSLRYMWPQFSAACGPHFCRPDHQRKDGTWQGTVRLVWRYENVHDGDDNNMIVTLPIWQCTAMDVARAVLERVRVADFLALASPYDQWADTMRERVPRTNQGDMLVPRLVAADAPFVKSRQSAVVDMLHYLCDVLHVCTRAHPASHLIDNIPFVNNALTVGHLLDPQATLSVFMAPEDFSLFRYSDKNELADEFQDASMYMWAATQHCDIEQTPPLLYMSPNVLFVPSVSPFPQYGQKEPMSSKGDDYADVDQWCREHGLPSDTKGARAGKCVPVTRRYESIACVNGTANFVAQIRGAKHNVHDVLVKRYPDTPCMYYGAVRAQRSLLLIQCDSTEQRDQRIEALRQMLGPQGSQGALAASSEDASKPRVRKLNKKTLALLDEWLIPPAGGNEPLTAGGGESTPLEEEPLPKRQRTPPPEEEEVVLFPELAFDEL